MMKRLSAMIRAFFLGLILVSSGSLGIYMYWFSLQQYGFLSRLLGYVQLFLGVGCFIGFIVLIIHAALYPKEW